MLLTNFFNCTGHISFNEMGRVSWMVNMQGLCVPNSYCNQNIARFSILYTTTSTNHLTLLYLLTLWMYAYLPPHILNLPAIMTVTQLLKNCPVFYPVVQYHVNISPHWTLPLAYKSCPHARSNLLKIHCNTIIPTFIKSPKLYLPFRNSD
jgi:hypothetical protein